MLFAVFVLNSAVGERNTVFDVAAFVVLASIVAHGFTDTVGAGWIERRRSSRPAASDAGSCPHRTSVSTGSRGGRADHRRARPTDGDDRAQHPRAPVA